MGKPVNSEEYPSATITGLYIGDNADSFVTQPVDLLELDHEGIVGEPRGKRRGLLMDADVRTRGVRKGTLVPHQQHVSMIDELSLDLIADRLEILDFITQDTYGLDRRQFVAGCIGANIILDSVRPTSLYRIPNGSLVGPVDEAGFFKTAVQISRYNAPCINPGKVLEQRYPLSAGIHNMAARFVEVAEHCRGVVAGVYVAGSLSVGEAVSFVPRQVREY